jgi:hypothetical protein
MGRIVAPARARRIDAGNAVPGRSLDGVIALYAAMQGVGLALCLFAAFWSWRTRHQRLIWRNTRHDTARAAIVLELEEKVRELEQHSVETVDVG